jgi:precorrin-6Y C5,15-methyltransferase (decarboxylating)
MNTVFVIGMGLSDKDLTAAHCDLIRSADILAGGRRHLAAFADLEMEKHVITGDVDATMEFIRSRRKDCRIVVLASGDPLFFGIGTRMVRELGRDQVVVLPNISSIAAAFARIGEPWEEAAIVSLHGRENGFKLPAALKTHGPVAVLTDGKHTPAWLAQWLLDNGADHMQMAVFEQLGSADERFGWYALDQAVAQTFEQPNVVVITPRQEVSGTVEDLHLGMPDQAYSHEAGLITKSEVRAVALAKLSLKPGQTLWDLGAGSGSVGIEASVLLGLGRIIAVEHNPERVRQIRQNARRYGVFNHTVVTARLPDGLDGLPPPDRIFIGGGGPDLAAIIEAAVNRLGPEGIVVTNTVLVSNLARAVDTLEAHGLHTDVVQLQVSRSRQMPWDKRLEAQNPVWIITGRRQ